MQKIIVGTNVSLSDFDKLPKPKIPNAKFSHFEFVNIQKYLDNPSHEDLQQDGVRDGNNNELEVNDLIAGFTQDGFKTTYFPPVFTQNKKRRDGTRRISSFVELQEKFIPAAIYNFDNEDSLVDKIVSGSNLNEEKDSNKPNTFENYKTQLSALVRLKAFNKSNRDEVRTYIREKLNLKHKSTRTINDLVEYVYNLREDGIRQIKPFDNINGMQYLNASYDFTNKYDIQRGEINKDNTKPYILLVAPNDDNVYRTVLKQILSNVEKNRKTVIVLYTPKYHHTQAVERERMKAFPKKVDAVVESVGKFVSNQLKGISITEPFTSDSYEFAGVIPQFETDEHRALFKFNKLIDIEKY